MSDFKKYVIIVSGGTGSRMNSATPKQFLELNKVPLLMHTIRAFNASDIHIVLVQNDTHAGIWASLCTKHQFDVPHSLVSGGKTRFHSVQNGLRFIVENEADLGSVLIAVHDGARPFVSKKIIEHSFQEVIDKKAVVPAIESRDSLRIISDGGINKALKREKVRLVQTPQTFFANILYDAYASDYNAEFTDDASVVEKSGYPIHLIEGDIRNIKITYPIDIAIAESWMNN